jgi:hypothetical protein
LLIIDEAAFIDEIEDIYPSAQKTLATGGKAIIISTPNGVGNWFHRNFTEGELGTNGMTAIKLPWHLHPERGEEYRKNEDVLLGKKMAAQENDCDFMTSGDTVIDPEILNTYEKAHIKEPVKKEGISDDLWIWEYPDSLKTYMVVADVSRGDDKDYSAFHIIDTKSFVQVAEFKCKVPTREFASILVSMAVKYNMALLIVENSSIGWDVINSIIEMHYPNLYYSPKAGSDLSAENYIGKMDNDQTVPGFTNSLKTRPLIVSKLKDSINSQSFIFRSARFMNELRTFIWNGPRAEAMKGYNDDLCLAAAIGTYVRDFALRFDNHGLEMARATMQGISRTSPPIINQNPLKGGINPWQMQIGDKTHDLTWLLE